MVQSLTNRVILCQRQRTQVAVIFFFFHLSCLLMRCSTNFLCLSFLSSTDYGEKEAERKAAAAEEEWLWRRGAAAEAVAEKTAAAAAAAAAATRRRHSRPTATDE